MPYAVAVAVVSDSSETSVEPLVPSNARCIDIVLVVDAIVDVLAVRLIALDTLYSKPINAAVIIDGEVVVEVSVVLLVILDTLNWERESVVEELVVVEVTVVTLVALDAFGSNRVNVVVVVVVVMQIMSFLPLAIRTVICNHVCTSPFTCALISSSQQVSSNWYALALSNMPTCSTTLATSQS
mmetsp:Transcript_101625/g.160281  ORF Transcript_101625/g.160281 Transcript_101625/m.160281 type:complete len:183 (+) Transcript_101625:1722-2270(+)